MWTDDKLSLLDNSMGLFSKVIVYSIFLSIVYLIYKIGISFAMTQIIINSFLIFVILMSFYYIAARSSNRNVVEAATYVFSILRNKQPIIKYYIPNGFEKNKSDESKRIYKFTWK